MIACTASISVRLVVTARLPAELAEKLDGLAERLDRPKGWIVKEAVASYVALEEKRAWCVSRGLRIFHTREDR